MAASASIFGGEEAVFIASTVKMVQNSAIGFLSVLVTIFWQFKTKTKEKKSFLTYLGIQKEEHRKTKHPKRKGIKEFIKERKQERRKKEKRKGKKKRRKAKERKKK